MPSLPAAGLHHKWVACFYNAWFYLVLKAPSAPTSYVHAFSIKKKKALVHIWHWKIKTRSESGCQGSLRCLIKLLVPLDRVETIGVLQNACQTPSVHLGLRSNNGIPRALPVWLKRIVGYLIYRMREKTAWNVIATLEVIGEIIHHSF